MKPPKVKVTRCSRCGWPGDELCSVCAEKRTNNPPNVILKPVILDGSWERYGSGHMRKCLQ